ncbi:MAG TPA: histidine kinase [Rhodocyclaceae bacterium]|nr:histidine kinase [Rhodocyclaceae bacterium]
MWLRILVGVNLLGLLWTLAHAPQWSYLPRDFAATALWLEPPLIVLLPLLHLLNAHLGRLSPQLGWGVVTCLALSVVGMQHLLLTSYLAISLANDLLHALFWTGAACFAMRAYFDWRNTLYSPALAEARLLALTARIRPHFLYNSLNAVLGVIRHDPRRAEAALEALSDLFRVLMKENRQLVLLSDEISVARQYLELERLRLGERLRIDWQIDECPPDTLMPPLMLQPLLENAVYHGIEPSPTPAAITIQIGMHGKRIRINIANPVNPGFGNPGNQMALANIRERLMLFYDLEAELAVQEQSGRYTVVVDLPLRQKSNS